MLKTVKKYLKTDTELDMVITNFEAVNFLRKNPHYLKRIFYNRY